MKKNMTLILPWASFQDVHLVKDVGLFPYYISKEYNIEINILSYDNKLNGTKLDEWRGMKIIKLPMLRQYDDCPSFIKEHNLFNSYIKPFKEYLRNNISKINYLMFFHSCPATLELVKYAKKLNDSIIIYVKGDKCSFADFKDKYIFKHILKYKTYFSTENKEFFEYLTTSKKYNKFSSQIILAPNGIDDKSTEIQEIIKTKKTKEKQMLAVGRFGSTQKNTELLLRVLERLELKDWKVVFAGPLENNFKEYLENWYMQNPLLKEKVLFIGNIMDRKILYDYYYKSSVFLMPSRWESFGLAFLEAAFFGNFIVSTEVGAAKELIEGGKRGYFVKGSTFGNQDEKLIEEKFIKVLKEIIDEKIDIFQNIEFQKSFIEENYVMSKIVKNEKYKKIFN